MSKKAEEKYDPTFVHRSLFQAISAVRKYGIEKHGNRDDWLTTPSNEHFKSAQRHLTAAIAGEAFDMESGLPHIAMCVTNLMFEIERGNLTFERKLESSKEQERYDIKAKPNAKLEIGSTEQLIE